MISRYFQRWAAIAGLARLQPSAASLGALRPAVSADATGLRIGDDAMPWSEVRRLEAYKRDAYVGDALCLAILGPGDRVFEINEASPGWKEAVDAIEQFLPGAMPRTEWMVRLIASSPVQSVTVYPAA
jgi:hypothetical protein